MAGKLSARLRRIRQNPPVSRAPPDKSVPEQNRAPESFGPEGSGWSSAGYQVYKRSVQADLPWPVPREFSPALALMVPDLFRYGTIPRPQDLAFFDLETTGLSGGAGTLAFLGSLGRFRFGTGGEGSLVIDQYLLLDYPGESDFLEALKAEILREGSGPPLIVSYNGKTFDSQILKSRCLMNALVPPDYFHADLLHPARRLWKRVLPDCSQGTIETAILGLDRTGDTPGALAPEIWFSFLKSGDPAALLGICDHNLRDIKGLAALFLLLGKIGASPLEIQGDFKFDLEALALVWRETLLRRSLNPSGTIPLGEGEQALAGLLLTAGAKQGLPRCLYVLGQDLLKAGQGEEGKALLLTLAFSGAPAELKAAAFRALAVDAEWRGLDPGSALGYAQAALALGGIKARAREELERREERLLKKAGKEDGNEHQNHED